MNRSMPDSVCHVPRIFSITLETLHFPKQIMFFKSFYSVFFLFVFIMNRVNSNSKKFAPLAVIFLFCKCGPLFRSFVTKGSKQLSIFNKLAKKMEVYEKYVYFKQSW